MVAKWSEHKRSNVFWSCLTKRSWKSISSYPSWSVVEMILLFVGGLRDIDWYLSFLKSHRKNECHARWELNCNENTAATVRFLEKTLQNKGKSRWLMLWSYVYSGISSFWGTKMRLVISTTWRHSNGIFCEKSKNDWNTKVVISTTQSISLLTGWNPETEQVGLRLRM